MCRTFGDALAKLEQYGGNSKVVVAVPDINTFKIVDGIHDFIIICSDGVFDKLSNEEVTSLAWNEIRAG